MISLNALIAVLVVIVLVMGGFVPALLTLGVAGAANLNGRQARRSLGTSSPDLTRISRGF